MQYVIMLGCLAQLVFELDWVGLPPSAVARTLVPGLIQLVFK